MLIIVIHFPAERRDEGWSAWNKSDSALVSDCFFFMFFCTRQSDKPCRRPQKNPQCRIEHQKGADKKLLESVANLFAAPCTFQSRMRLHSIHRKSSGVSPTVFLSFSSSSSAFLEG